MPSLTRASVLAVVMDFFLHSSERSKAMLKKRNVEEPVDQRFDDRSEAFESLTFVANGPEIKTLYT